MTILAVMLMTAGIAFLAVSAVGLLRLPDFYTRAHAVAKSETLGIMLVVAGMFAYQGLSGGGVQLLFVLVFAMIANPTAIHALARAARRTGQEPWTKEAT